MTNVLKKVALTTALSAFVLGALGPLSFAGAAEKPAAGQETVVKDKEACPEGKVWDEESKSCKDKPAE